ncbi:hypothetical protein MLD38_012796 [Melastoma candidum]|uniref:Uncharacterized protein n=1 Tax=Melastoma candidum TaxID=119954 RepID=A0ACB9R6Y0_9MYRT|nr:hypothetical protein MLD38_012796 [Melastoma candidum]
MDPHSITTVLSQEDGSTCLGERSGWSKRCGIPWDGEEKLRTVLVPPSMGPPRCFSGPYFQRDCDCSSSGARTVKVITVSGHLREFRIPVAAAQVLRSGSSSSSSSAALLFICDSDRLYYDEFIQAPDLDEELVEGQLYFMLPRSSLQQPLMGF